MHIRRITCVLIGIGVLLAIHACSADNGDEGEGDGGGASGASGSGGGGSLVPSNLPTGNDVIDANDTNGDNMLSPGEVPAGFGNFTQIDTNGDGLLTEDEIVAAAQPGGELEGEVCAEGNAVGSRLAPKIVLLLDGSSSMNSDYGNTDRWGAMRAGMLDPGNGVVRTMEGLIQFGLVIYAGEYLTPVAGGRGECPVPGIVVGPGLNNYAKIEAAFPRNSPGRYTPTGNALQLVCEAMPGAEEDMTAQYVVLATDGQPNSCGGGNWGGNEDTNTDTSAEQTVLDAATFCCSKGVRLYVFSLASGGAEYQAHLQQVADIGACGSVTGSATVYSPADPAALSTALGGLMGAALTCDVTLNGSVVSGKECEGEVLLNGSPLGCNDSSGNSWILLNPTTIRLQGLACDRFKNDPTATISATFPCDAFVPGGGGAGGSSGAGGASGSSGVGGASGSSGSSGSSGNGPLF